MKKIVLVSVPAFNIFTATTFNILEENIRYDWSNEDRSLEEAYTPQETDDCDLDWSSPFAPTDADLHEYYLRSQRDGNEENYLF